MYTERNKKLMFFFSYGNLSKIFNFNTVNLTPTYQGSLRLEKYLNIQNCLEKSLNIKFALKKT